MIPMLTHDLKAEFFYSAVKKSGDRIRPVRCMKNILSDGAFTVFELSDGSVEIIFWYNDSNNSTHTVRKRYKNADILEKA